RMALYKKTEALTQVPWYYIAAVDQYERQILDSNEDEPLISIQIPEEIWFGPGNSTFMMDEEIVQLFNGKGKDGNGDGKVNPSDPEEVLYTMASILAEYGPTEDDIKIGFGIFTNEILPSKQLKIQPKSLKSLIKFTLKNVIFRLIRITTIVITIIGATVEGLVE